MSNDIFKDAILQTAKKYVNDNVKVSVYETDPDIIYSYYTLKIEYKNHQNSYRLSKGHVKHEGYIMRVVSDLCSALAQETQKERNYFFKRSDK